MAKHDENKDLRLVSRIAKVNSSNKTIKISKYTPIGIRTFSRIDYLVNCCGWTLVYDNNMVVDRNKNDNDEKKTHNREIKKYNKEQAINNKLRKQNKNKQHE